MSKFTSGQWRLDKTDGTIRANDSLVAQVYGATKHNHESNAEECFANARLILKAPVLYKILKPLDTCTEYKFSKVISAMREAQKVIEAIDTECEKHD